MSVVALLLAAAGNSQGGTTIFSNDLAGFNAAAGNPPVTVDFDDVADGTDASNMTIHGMKLNAIGNPLFVVAGNSTATTPGAFSGAIDIATNKLFPTSGKNVLSPGGYNLNNDPNQNDDLEFFFETPVDAFGFDLLSQSRDGHGIYGIRVFGENDVGIGSFQIATIGQGDGAPGGADFWGIVSDVKIKHIQLDDHDSLNPTLPDANIGFDTFRFIADGTNGGGGGTGNPIPLPAAIVAFPLAAALAKISMRSHCRSD